MVLRHKRCAVNTGISPILLRTWSGRNFEKAKLVARETRVLSYDYEEKVLLGFIIWALLLLYKQSDECL